MASALEAGVAGLALSDELAAVAERLQASVVQVRAGRGGIGSGVVWQTGAASPEADAGTAVTIVTNEHVVRAAGNGPLAVLVHDGRTLQAEVVAHDPEHDLALLRVRAPGLRPAPIGDSSALRVGELVLAVGNPFGQVNRLTTGIVAARAPADPDQPIEDAQPAPEAQSAEAHTEAPRPERPRRGPFDERQRAARTPDLIQADVRLYPGNSGGPLADAQGRVVGINSMVAGELALSIPSNVVRSFIAAATTLERERPYLGVHVLTVALPDALRTRMGIRAASGMLVGEVEPGSPAAQAGILVGDLLIEVASRPVAGARDLLVAVATSNTGQPLAVTIVRGGERQVLHLTPGRQDQAAA